MVFRSSLLVLPVLIACGDASVSMDVGVDSGFDAAPDASPDGSVDGAIDAARDANPDAAADSSSDTGALGGFGDIAGPCAMIGPELTSGEPSYFLNRLDFGEDAFDDPEDVSRLTPGGQEILAEGTAGGSSGLSEAFAYEVLARCEGATLLKSETEIVYTDAMGKITDLLVEMDGTKLGVSVTRAFVFPPSDPFTVEIAEERLSDKLADVLLSSLNVAPEDAWQKQILLIMAYADMHAESLMAAWATLDPALTADTIVYVVITDGMDAPLY